MRWWAAAAVALLLGLAAGAVWGLTRPEAQVGSATYGSCGEAGDPDRRPLEGFGEVAFAVLGADDTRVEGCALLADTPEARSQGLMAQRDLRGYDAMVFRFPEPVAGGFYMFQTVVPLSIAFVDEGGEVVSVADMVPCVETDPAACPTTGADEAYLHAVEVLAGGLEPLGIVPGARLAFGGAVTPPP